MPPNSLTDDVILKNTDLLRVIKIMMFHHFHGYSHRGFPSPPQPSTSFNYQTASNLPWLP